MKRFFLQVLKYDYINLLCMHGLKTMLLVQGRKETVVLSRVTTVTVTALLHYTAIDRLQTSLYRVEWKFPFGLNFLQYSYIKLQWII